MSTKTVLLRVALVVAVAVVGVVLVTVLAPAGAPETYRPIGDAAPLPDTQLATVGRAEFDGLLVGQRGTPVIVNVWASWCAPCRAEMPLLDRAAADYEGRVVFLGVASKDSRGEAAEFLDDVGVTYPSVFDATGDVRQALGLRGFPTTYFFDASGDLVDTITGG